MTNAVAPFTSMGKTQRTADQSIIQPSEKFCCPFFPEEPLGVRDRNLLAVLSVQPVGVMAGRGVACKQRKYEYLPQCCGSGIQDGKKSGPGIIIRDHISANLVTIF
jgi:hypothetical protein